MLFKGEAILASSVSKFGKWVALIYRDDWKSSTESTISTSLILNVPSEGTPEQELTWVLNLIFQHESVASVCGIHQNEAPRFAIFAGQKLKSVVLLLERRVHGWWSSCKTRHGNCASNLFFTFRNKSPCTRLHGVFPPPVLWFKEWRTPWYSVCNEAIAARGWPETFPCVPDKFRVSDRRLWSRLNTGRGLGTTAGWLGTWDDFQLKTDSFYWDSLESCIPFHRILMQN